MVYLSGNHNHSYHISILGCIRCCEVLEIFDSSSVIWEQACDFSTCWGRVSETILVDFFCFAKLISGAFFLPIFSCFIIATVQVSRLIKIFERGNIKQNPCARIPVKNTQIRKTTRLLVTIKSSLLWIKNTPFLIPSTA